jgi:hypothetical protein
MSLQADRKRRETLAAPRTFHASSADNGRWRRAAVTLVPLDELDEPVATWFNRPMEMSNRPVDPADLPVAPARAAKAAPATTGLFATLFGY